MIQAYRCDEAEPKAPWLVVAGGEVEGALRSAGDEARRKQQGATIGRLVVSSKAPLNATNPPRCEHIGAATANWQHRRRGKSKLVTALTPGLAFFAVTSPRQSKYGGLVCGGWRGGGGCCGKGGKESATQALGLGLQNGFDESFFQRCTPSRRARCQAAGCKTAQAAFWPAAHWDPNSPQKAKPEPLAGTVRSPLGRSCLRPLGPPKNDVPAEAMRRQAGQCFASLAWLCTRRSPAGARGLVPALPSPRHTSAGNPVPLRPRRVPWRRDETNGWFPSAEGDNGTICSARTRMGGCPALWLTTRRPVPQTRWSAAPR